MSQIALALLIFQGQILLFRREQKEGDQFAGMFGFPGGHVEDQENTKEAAVRETWEETCVMMHQPKFVNSYKFENNTIYLYAEEIQSIDGVRLNHEHTEFKLFKPQELKTNPEIIPTCKFMYNDYLRKS
jgi:ADP-ribose pyrophosphatase YjhB (NUDIX family)